MGSEVRWGDVVHLEDGDTVDGLPEVPESEGGILTAGHHQPLEGNMFYLNMLMYDKKQNRQDQTRPDKTTRNKEKNREKKGKKLCDHVMVC